MGCLSCAPSRGPGPQPRHGPWPGIKLVTFWFVGHHSTHWATPVRAGMLFFFNHSAGTLFLTATRVFPLERVIYITGLRVSHWSLSSHGSNSKAFCCFFLSSSLKSQALLFIGNPKPTTKWLQLTFTTLSSLTIPLSIFCGQVWLSNLWTYPWPFYCLGVFPYRILACAQLSLSAAVPTAHPSGSSRSDPAYTCPYSLTATCLEKSQCSRHSNEYTMPLPKETLWTRTNASILQAFKWCWGFAA